ncbi:MAG: TrkH family potassium uptake protein, partial [Clostridia bacterium]|nr:TrkH family potassium uptake protein [Clostridia bacterium]
MNYKMIFYTVGQVLFIEAVMLVLPVAVALIYAEWSGALALAVTAVAALGAGLALTLPLKRRNPSIYAKEGLIIVSFAWIAVSLVGALPFVISGEIPSYIDALFETVSGFTTT